MPIGTVKKDPTNAMVARVMNQLRFMPSRKQPPAGALAAHWQLGMRLENTTPMPNTNGQIAVMSNATRRDLRAM